MRELRSVLDRAIYIATASGEHERRLVDLPVSAAAAPPSGVLPEFTSEQSYRETRAVFETDLERAYVTCLLARHDGNISAAAREAKTERTHLFDLARKHGMR